MDLSERKRRILKAIIENYIETAEPVGSKMIAGHFTQPISSATIRNEMSELEELGLLEKPHVSAGRVPSYAAYRLYVNELMDQYRVVGAELERMHREILAKMRELDNMMLSASRVVSQLTDHTAVSIVSRRSGRHVKRVELIAMDEGLSYAVVLVLGDTVKNRVYRLRELVDPVVAQALARSFTQALAEGKAEQVPLGIVQAVGEQSALSQFAERILEFIADAEDEASIEMYLDGAQRLLRNREYQDAEKARDLLEYLSDQTKVSELVGKENYHVVQVKIGPETGEPRLRDASFVYTAYPIGGQATGVIGIVAPTRMDYARACARISALALQLAQLAAPPEKDNRNEEDKGEKNVRHQRRE